MTNNLDRQLKALGTKETASVRPEGNATPLLESIKSLDFNLNNLAAAVSYDGFDSVAFRAAMMGNDPSQHEVRIKAVIVILTWVLYRGTNQKKHDKTQQAGKEIHQAACQLLNIRGYDDKKEKAVKIGASAYSKDDANHQRVVAAFPELMSHVIIETAKAPLGWFNEMNGEKMESKDVIPAYLCFPSAPSIFGTKVTEKQIEHYKQCMIKMDLIINPNKSMSMVPEISAEIDKYYQISKKSKLFSPLDQDKILNNLSTVSQLSERFKGMKVSSESLYSDAVISRESMIEELMKMTSGMEFDDMDQEELTRTYQRIQKKKNASKVTERKKEESKN